MHDLLPWRAQYPPGGIEFVNLQLPWSDEWFPRGVWRGKKVKSELRAGTTSEKVSHTRKRGHSLWLEGRIGDLVSRYGWGIPYRKSNING